MRKTLLKHVGQEIVVEDVEPSVVHGGEEQKAAEHLVQVRKLNNLELNDGVWEVE